MARIKYSALVSDVRGIVGGNVFSRNKGGGYVRTFVKPNNPQTERQQIQRLILGAVAGLWRTLTEEQRITWGAAASDFPYKDKLGEDKTYSGQQLFMKFNSFLKAIGIAAKTNAPAPVEMPTAVLSASDSTPLDFDVIATLPEIPTDKAYVSRATRPLSPGRMNAFRQEFKQISTATIAAAETTVVNSTDYRKVYSLGAGDVGSKVFVEIIIVDKNTGQASAPLKFSVILTAD